MKPQDAYRAGISAYHAGRYSDAIRHLTATARGRGTLSLLGRFYLGQAHYRLAMSLLSAEVFAEAAEHFREAARLNPCGCDFGRFLAGCYVGSGRLDLAASELEKLLRRDPSDVSTRVRLALAQYRQGQPAAAVSSLREGLARTPNDAELHYQLGVLMAGEGDLAAAEASFKRAVQLDHEHAAAHERLAQCCSVAGRHERARAYLQRAHELDPYNARIAWQFALLAPQGFRAAAVQPRTAKTRADHGQSVAGTAAPATEPSARDLERLGEVIAAEPDFVEAFLALPSSEVDQEIFSTLAATLEQALRKHPEYADLHYHCGAVYRRLGRSGEAIAHAERAVRLNPRYVNALILLAGLYARTNRWMDGIKRLEEAIEAGGDYPDVHALVGELYARAGRLGPARRAYERALQLNDHYAPAREALAALPG